MTEQMDRRPRLRRRAEEILSRLSHQEREDLLVRCWTSHDARWFMVAAQAFGMEVANRLNRAAAHEEGEVEARRIIRALGLPPVATPEDYLVAQEVFIGLLGPRLLDYQVADVGEGAFALRIQRCFAHENVMRAGIADAYECGIMARVTGWLDALGLRYEMTPPPGKCPKAQGGECAYTLKLLGRAD